MFIRAELSVPISILGWIFTSIGLLQTSLGGSHAPVMLVGNKSDRVTEREVSTQGSALAKEMGCDFVEASAKQCINVEKAFYEVVRSLRKQRQDTQITRMGTNAGSNGGSPAMVKALGMI